MENLWKLIDQKGHTFDTWQPTNRIDVKIHKPPEKIVTQHRTQGHDVDIYQQLVAYIHYPIIDQNELYW